MRRSIYPVNEKRENYFAKSSFKFKFRRFQYKREGKLIYSDINNEIMKC